MKEEENKLGGIDFIMIPLEDEMVEEVTRELWDALRPKEFDNDPLVTCKLIIFDCSEGGKINDNPTKEDWLKLIQGK